MARKGRPRKIGARRYPSGGVVHEDPRLAACEARQRHYGLSAAVAMRADAGSALGRLLIAGEISADQHEAGRRFAEVADAMRRICLVGSYRSGSALDNARGHDASDGDDPAYITYCQAVRRRYEVYRRAVLTCGEPLAMMVITAVTVDDLDMPMRVGELRAALDAVMAAAFRSL